MLLSCAPSGSVQEQRSALKICSLPPKNYHTALIDGSKKQRLRKEYETESSKLLYREPKQSLLKPLTLLHCCNLIAVTFTSPFTEETQAGGTETPPWSPGDPRVTGQNMRGDRLCTAAFCIRAPMSPRHLG